MGRAAEELFVTPGAVSQQIQQLEAWMGMPMFVRSGRKLQLTAEGRRLGKRLESVFDQLEQAVEELRAGAESSHLRLRMAPTLAIRWLVPDLGEFIGRHPEIELEVSTTAIPDESALGDFDLAVRICTEPPTDVDWIELFRDAFVPVCSPATARLLREPADLDSLPRLHSIIRPECWAVWLDHVGLDLDPLAGPKFANAALAYQAAADGLGVAIGQRTYVDADLRAGKLVAPFSTIACSPQTYFLVNARYKSQWPKVRLFRNWCSELVARSAFATDEHARARDRDEDGGLPGHARSLPETSRFLDDPSHPS